MKRIIDKAVPFFVLIAFAILVLSVVRTSIFGIVEPEQHIYFEIVFLLLIAVAGELLVVHLKQPSVMILMVIGIVLGPSFLQIPWDALPSLGFQVSGPPPQIFRSENIIHVFAQLGAIILLFKVGLHNKIDRVFTRQNLIVATCGVIIPFAAGFLYASMTGGNFAYSMFLAAALTATSVGVTVALLKEFKLIDEDFSQIIIGAALIDDVLGLLVLSFVINATGGSGSLEPLLLTGISAAVFLVGAVFTGKYLVNYMDRKEFGPRRLLFALSIVIFYAYIAEFIKLSAIVGAFIAGIVLNQSRHAEKINEQTYGLELVFTPIFFITLGMLVDVGSLAEYAAPIIIITLIAFFTKVLGCIPAGLISKLDLRKSIIVGVGMAPRGEVALIIASLGLTYGVLNPDQYSIIAAMALLTTLMVPPILGHLFKNRAQ